MSEQFVEQLRSEYEARLFAATSKAERALIEKEQAEAALARQRLRWRRCETSCRSVATP